MAKSKINRIAKKSSLAKLSASYKFGKLVCRESEIQKLDAILKNALSMKFSSGSGLYISGMPGTGKTTVVSYVINGLGKMATKGDLPNFLYINVNAMKLMSPSQIYMTILKKMFRNQLGPLASQKLLESLLYNKASRKSDLFVKGSRILKKHNNTILLVVDELDCLLTPDQDVLYDLFDWPHHFHSTKIVLVGIANTMDLPERMSKKVQSRLGMERIVFQPYNRKQIELIIRERLGQSSLFENEAIEFCSRKVASLSGDIRQALAICAKAIELKIDQKTKVTIQDVVAVIENIEGDFISKTINNMPLFQKLLLSSVVLCLKNGKCDFLSVYAKLCSILTRFGEEFLDKFEVLDLICCLKDQRIIEVAGSFSGNFKIEMVGFEQDYIYVLEIDEDCERFFE